MFAALSEEHTDMAGFLRRDRSLPSMLTGVETAKKPFHGLSKLQKFDVMRKILTMRIGLSIKFEALRKAQMAVQRSLVISKALGMDGQGGCDPEEARFIQELLAEQTDLAAKIVKVEKERMDKALKVLDGKIKTMEMLSKCKVEFDAFQADSEDEDERMDENDAPNVDKEIRKKENRLQKDENKVQQMKTVIQRLIFTCPNAISAYDEEINKKHQDMLLFCGKSVEEMRQQLSIRN